MNRGDVDSQVVESVDFINSLKFCPFEGGADLIAVASDESLNVSSCTFTSGDQDYTGNYTQSITTSLVDEYMTLIKFKVSDVNCIAWSPLTNIKHLPRRIIIAAGIHDGALNVYSTNLKDETFTSSLNGHTDCVNDCAFEPNEGQELASVSDDHSCKVWDCGTSDLLVSFPLQYAGVSVCWHPEKPGKLMVAELGGRIRFYDIEMKQAILSLDCKKGNLISADWCWLDHNKLGASADLEWYLWDISKSSFPLDSQQAHSEGCRKLLWSRHHEDVFLTLGRPKNTLKIYHLGHRQPIVHKVHETSMCASWHSRLPICAVAGNKSIHFYDTKSCTQF